MKKSMNYFVYFIMGIVAETIFLKLARHTGQVDTNLVATYFLVGLFFLMYRFVIDWRFFHNRYSHELRMLAIKEDSGSKFFYSAFLGISILVANSFLHLPNSTLGLLFFSMMSVAFTWYSFNSIRSIHNRIKGGEHTWTSSQQSQKLQSIQLCYQ